MEPGAIAVSPNSLEQVIFILGIKHRCGTNFLSNLLQLHPECGLPDPVWEDFLLAGSHLLVDYSDWTYRQWNPCWGVSQVTQKDLDASLGSGITSFLFKRSAGNRVIAKTPSVANLDLFFRFFSGAKLLILVRNGRSVIESGIKSFGWSREVALHEIADSANLISSFVQEHGYSGKNHRVIRYEELWNDTENQLRALFAFLQLDPELYDYQAAENLPVKGSSDLLDQGKEIHWDQVERSERFNPLVRFEHWNIGHHARYNHVAGRQMAALGYENTEERSSHGFYVLMNGFLDISWWFRIRFRTLLRRYQSLRTYFWP